GVGGRGGRASEGIGRGGRGAGRVATIWQAGSRVEAVPLPRQRRQATGRQTGRVMNGRRTTTPTSTHRWPNASLLRLGADPSWIHHAPEAFFPRRRGAGGAHGRPNTPSAAGHRGATRA